jgi:hypothetical protein
VLSTSSATLWNNLPRAPAYEAPGEVSSTHF